MEEIIYVNGMAYKMESSVLLTQKQKNIVIQQLSNSSNINDLNNSKIMSLANLEGASVTVKNSSNTIVFNGITGTDGIALEGGLKPNLPYGNYIINATKTGYYDATPVALSIPADTSKTIKISLIYNQITITITD